MGRLDTNDAESIKVAINLEVMQSRRLYADLLNSNNFEVNKESQKYNLGAVVVT